MGVLAAAAGLFVTALFLPWQTECFPPGPGFGAGRCFSANGWTYIPGATAGLLGLLLVAASVGSLGRLVPELAIAVALLTATAGLALVSVDIAGLGFGYGSFVGFVAAGLLVAAALIVVRVPTCRRERLLARLPAAAAALAYLVIVVVPWWRVLPYRLEAQSRAPFSWLTLAGVLIAIHLLMSWLRRIADESAAPARLVVLPIALLAFAALDLIRLRDQGITWAAGGVVGICLFLTAAGALETRGRIDDLRLPEILRIDRI
jgi:hypothetical protein